MALRFGQDPASPYRCMVNADVSQEQRLSQLGPDERLPHPWQHAVTWGLIESGVSMELAHQVIDDLKRILKHHMSRIDQYTVRP